jgi:hypothetical protein
MQPPPPALAEARPPAVDPRPALGAWKHWAKPPDAATAAGAAGLQALADHLGQALEQLTREIQALSKRVAEALAERDELWAPVAFEVSSWCADAAIAQDGMTSVAAIKAADKWLKEATDDIRNPRLAPLADQARGIWAMLRQESNVDLGAIRLAGRRPSGMWNSMSAWMVLPGRRWAS